MKKVLLALVLGVVPLLAQAQGVNIKDLPPATTPLSSSDLFAVTQGGTFHKLPGTSLGLAAGLGTMSMQNANAVAITGGTAEGMAGLGATPTISLTNVAYNPAFSSMYSVATVSGVINSTNALNVPTGAIIPINYNVCSDTATSTFSPATLGMACHEVSYNGVGSGTGNRQGLEVDMLITGTAAQTAGSAFYNGIVVTTAAASNLGGILGGEIGDIYGVSTQTYIKTGATHLASVHGAGEWDLLVQAGASVANKIGAEIVLLATDATQGSNIDAALLFDNYGSTAWKFGIEFGVSGTSFPVASTGTIIGTQISAGNAAQGVDFSSIAFSGCAFKTAGNCMTNLGLVVGGQTLIGGVTFQTHAAFDQNFIVEGKANLADGVNLESVNDASSTLKGFEIQAPLQFK